MGVKEFSVNLDTNRQVFYPGETITGYVVVDLQGHMIVKGVNVEFDGKAECHWTEKRYEGTGEERREVVDHIKGKEKYFEYKTCLFGAVSGTAKYSHPHGRYIYPFVFNIPANLPSSFEGQIGRIRYEIKAEVDIPGKKDLVYRRPLTINEIVDTNDPNYAKTPGGEVHKEVGCLCWKAGPLDVSANIDREGYCPGELILINSQVQNKTTRDMKAMKAKLIQTVTYTAEGNRMKHETSIVARLDGPEVPKGEFATWSNQPLGIPATQPTIKNSRVIKVSYVVKLEIDVPWGMDPTITMPIVVGTVPFRGCYGVEQQFGLPQEQMPVPDSNFSNTPLMPPAPSNLLGYPDMAPPSYAAVVGSQRVNFHSGDKSELHGNSTFVPVYTFARAYTGNLRIEQHAPQSGNPAPMENPSAPPPPGIAPLPPPPAFVPHNAHPGYPQPQQPGYPPPHPGYAPQQPGYAPQQPGYAPRQPAYAPQPGYSPHPGYPQ